MTAPTTREAADRETLVMQSIIDAHGQWEIENRNRKQGDGQLWQDGHARLLAQAAIIAADHIGEANEKVTADHAELARLAEAATPGCWTCKEGYTTYPECDDRDFWAVVLSPAGREIVQLNERGYHREDDRVDYDFDAAFIAAANPATVLSLLSEIAALRGERRNIVSHATMGATDGDGLTVNAVSVEITRLRNAMHASYHTRATQAERQRDEAVGLLKRWSLTRGEMYGAGTVETATSAFLANQGPDQ